MISLPSAPSQNSEVDPKRLTHLSRLGRRAVREENTSIASVLSFQWSAPEKPQEDALWRDEKRGVFLVADGITRTPPTVGYPNPSPAKLAADCLVEEIQHSLLTAPRTPAGLRAACRAGNQRVAKLNQQLGLADRCDWWENDLAGAVFAGLLLDATEFVWGFLTDCGVAHLSPAGELLWITPDQLTPVHQYFPPPPQTRDKQVAIRRDYRNKPDKGLDRTYGAFTGEETAIVYLQTNSRTYEAGDVLTVFTDGAHHLVTDAPFQALLARGTSKDIERYTADPAHCTHQDDKTLIVIRTT